MKNLIFFVSLTAMSLFSYAAEFDQASYERDMQRSRLENTWQLQGSLGTGGLSTDHNSELKAFSDSSGFGIPLAISVSAYHPRQSPGLMHWGYILELLAYDKTKASWVSNESIQYSQMMVGGGLLYYLDDSRQSFLRTSLGLAGANVREEKKGQPFSNGFGISVELGSTFELETFNHFFTYSARATYLTATNLRTTDDIEVLSLTANVGLLW